MEAANTKNIKLDSFEVIADTLHNVRDYIRWAASAMAVSELSFNHGMSNALDEAVYLVLKALHLPIDTANIYWDGRLTLNEKKVVYTLIEQRILTRMPAAYLTQEGWFCGLPFYVDERVLIPRSPISELIEQQFLPWVDEGGVDRILDLCSGSGCIGIACAYAFPGAEVVLSDISDEALTVAQINIERHDLSQQVSTKQSDGLLNLKGHKFDLIVCNPPYVDAEDMQGLDVEFSYEPSLALASGVMA